MTDRRRRVLSLIPLLAALAAYAVGTFSVPRPAPQELRFDGARAFADLEALVTRFGPRPTGNPKCEDQAKWIRDRFQEAGLEARVDFGEKDKLPLWNAVGIVPGTGDRFIVVLGHHDSVTAAPGAEDNGSAVAALIELGRALKGRPLRHTVFLCATDSEENGGQGAEMFVDRLGPDGIARTDACIGLEMLAWPGGTPVLHALPRNFAAVVEGYVPAPLPAAVVAASPESLAFADPYFSPIVQSLSRYARVPSGSDDILFFRAGVPSVLLARSSLIRFYPYYHGTQDTPDKLTPEALQSSGRILEAGVLAVDEIPNPREGPTEYLLLWGAVLDQRILGAVSGITALCLLVFAWLGFRARPTGGAGVSPAPAGGDARPTCGAGVSPAPAGGDARPTCGAGVSPAPAGGDARPTGGAGVSPAPAGGDARPTVAQAFQPVPAAAAREWKKPLGACLVALPLLLTAFRFAPLVLVAVWPVGAFYMIVASIRNRFLRLPLFWIPLFVVIAVPMVFWAARRSFGVQLPAAETGMLIVSATLAIAGYAFTRSGDPAAAPAPDREPSTP